MRKILVAAMTAGLLAVAAPAFAGPGGTSETSNNVDCNSSAATQRQQVPGSGIFISADGNQAAPQNGGSLVVCNESATNNGAPAPIQGRIIASGGTGGGYIAADGDANNPPEAQGWARLNISSNPSAAGPRCGGPADPGTSTDSTTNNGSQAACG